MNLFAIIILQPQRSCNPNSSINIFGQCRDGILRKTIGHVEVEAFDKVLADRMAPRVQHENRQKNGAEMEEFSHVQIYYFRVDIGADV